MTGRGSILQSLTGGAVRYVRPVASSRAEGLVKRVYSQARVDFGLVPPLTMNSPNPQVLAAVWVLLREIYIVGRGRPEREMVAAAVSQANTCPYCVEVHGGLLHAAAEQDLADELLRGGTPARPQPLAEWAARTATRHSAMLRKQPFPAERAAQLMGTAVTYHLLNRMVNVFLEPSPSPLRLNSVAARGFSARLFGATMGKRLVSIQATPGLSLELLPQAAQLSGFDWAAGDPRIGEALLRSAAAFEHAGRACVPKPVRGLVQDYLSGWDGQEPGLSPSWLDEALAGLKSESDRASARLALLTAICSYRIGEPEISRFRRFHSGDADLVATVAWASWQAARRIGNWIPGPVGQESASLKSSSSVENP